jgi:hypothetical protein
MENRLSRIVRLERACRDIVQLARGGVFRWDHIRAVHVHDLVAMQEHSTIHEVRRFRFSVTDDV